MKAMKIVARTSIGVLVVVGALLLMLGQFWLLYVAPLLIFVGVALVYGYLSSKPKLLSVQIESESSSSNKES